jgi:hypothetical protein
MPPVAQKIFFAAECPFTEPGKKYFFVRKREKLFLWEKVRKTLSGVCRLLKLSRECLLETEYLF